MIRKLCALGLVCGPIPLLVGILFGSKVFQYLIQNKIDKIIKSDKYSLEEKINLGITDKKLKIIVDGIDSDFVNDSEKWNKLYLKLNVAFLIGKKSIQ